MFTQGFEKTAGASIGEKILRLGTRAASGTKNFVTDGRAVGKAITGPPTKAIRVVSESGRKVREGIKNWGRQFSYGLSEGRGATKQEIARRERMRTRQVGLSGAEREVKNTNKNLPKGFAESKVTPELIKKHKQEAIERAKRIKGVRDKKPSFMQRHPLFTLGAGIVAGKAISGERKEEPSPQMMYPQY